MRSYRPVQTAIIWELRKKGLCKYWYYELQHSLLAAVGSDRLHSSPAHLTCRFTSLDALPISQNCYQMWENLERVKSCGLKQLARRRRFESEHVKPGRRGTSSCTDGMNSALQVSQEHKHVTAMVKAMGQAVTGALRNGGATAQA